MELTAFHSSVLKKIEIGGFVFTKRQPLQQQQPSNLDYSKSNRGMNTDIIAEKNRESNNENSTGEQYAAMDEMMNEHDNPATSTPTTSSRTMRRSSLGLRGKRAVNGAYPSPHQSIPPCNFYTLIDAELSDPLRMKQLLTWCASKTMEDFPFEKKSPVDAVVHSVQKQVLEALKSKALNTSWYQREAVVDNNSQIPHPNNIENAKKISEFKEQLLQLEDELKEWSQIKKNHQDEHAKHLDQYDPLSLNRDSICSMVDRDFASLLHSIDSACQESDDLVKDFNQNTQFKVHALQHMLHQSHVNSDDMSRSCEHLYSKMLRAYMERENRDLKRVDPFQILSLLSKAKA